VAFGFGEKKMSFVRIATHPSCFRLQSSARASLLHLGQAVALATVFSGMALFGGAAPPQSSNSGTIAGAVTDPSGAVVQGATVSVENPVSKFNRAVTTDNAGKFTVPNVPANHYHLKVEAPGFTASAQDVDVRSGVPVTLSIALVLTSSTETVNVQGEAGDLLENDPTFHTDVDRQLFDRMPLESQSSQLSSLVTLATPGVAADSNGLFHGLGDHAQNSFSLDGQPITDQQSKVFSNQVPVDAVQSMQVISGAPPAEYGDKTSLVIDVTTRTGLGSTTPHGEITASYGTFGSSNLDMNFSVGNQKWGNFFAANGLDTGRFLDPPEFVVFHAHGNEENFFDRLDYVVDTNNTLHMNLGFTRSWFQNPNSYDQLNTGVLGPDGLPVGQADQRARILTWNIAPSWSHTLSTNAVVTLAAYARHDQFNYYPSANPFADFGPIQSESVAQYRTLFNFGVRGDLSYTKGIHNLKIGANYMQTPLTENDQLGIVNPTLNSPCIDSGGNPVLGFNDPAQCAQAGLMANPGYNSVLSCYDLTRPMPSPAAGCTSQVSTYYRFVGHTDVKELGLYVQDSINWKNWGLNVGIRGDLYNGLTTARQAEPRVGLSYNIQKTNTVLQFSYARTLETPFNENLVLSNNGCFNPIIASLVPCVPASLPSGYRNEFHAGLQQAIGKFLVVNGEYIWKYTRDAFDFSILGNTPIFFPIAWHNSKIPGFALRVSVPTYHGFSALVVMSSVAARYFPPQTGGLGVTVGQSGFPFRIDHDERFNQTMHLQYQTPWKIGPWFGFNWRYDSGLVAGAVPCYGILPFNNCPTSTNLPNGAPAVNLSGLTADQQFQAGLFCGSARPTPFTPLPSPCPAGLYGSSLVSIPAPNAQNDDKNPARIAPRSLFDLAIGDDNLYKFGKDRYHLSAQLTVINLADKVALYNFLSTFSGTHYVTPRTITGAIGIHF
jgi:hypothetical protein